MLFFRLLGFLQRFTALMEGEHERGWAALLTLEVHAFDVDGVIRHAWGDDMMSSFSFLVVI